MKKALFLILASLCAFSCLAVLAQEKAGQAASAKKVRWEGMVQVINKDASSMTVRKMNSTQEKTIYFDNSTKWVSQEHGSKKVNPIDSSAVKDGDRVICEGTEENGKFHATLISKRLTPP